VGRGFVQVVCIKVISRAFVTSSCQHIAIRPGNQIKIYQICPSKDRPDTTQPILRWINMIFGLYLINRFYYI
jgi:hypothetical protein